MANNIVKIYGDGEFWIDGQRRAKLYPNGEIWANSKLVGKIYSDGEIWIDGAKVGRVYSDGELWIGGKKVATGIHLLSLLETKTNAPKTEVYSGVRKSTSFQWSGSGGGSGGGDALGCGFLFVIVLLIVAMIYACFRFWVSELPQILFGNMQNLGKVAMISIYVCMFIGMYLHCSMATQSGQVSFWKALTVQGGAFIANVVVFTVLDVLITAANYGISLGDVLGELGGLLSGNLLGLVCIACLVGMAPTIVSSIISAICIRKGVTVDSPSFKKGSITMPKNMSKTVKVILALVLGALTVYANAAIPFVVIMGTSVLEYLPIGEIIWVPMIAIAIGIGIRRKRNERKYHSFWSNWAIQSTVMTVGNCINANFMGVADAEGGYILVTALLTFAVGLLVTWLTVSIADEY